jgi:hypothetical protein
LEIPDATIAIAIIRGIGNAGLLIPRLKSSTGMEPKRDACGDD